MMVPPLQTLSVCQAGQVWALVLPVSGTTDGSVKLKPVLTSHAAASLSQSAVPAEQLTEHIHEKLPVETRIWPAGQSGGSGQTVLALPTQVSAPLTIAQLPFQEVRRS